MIFTDIITFLGRFHPLVVHLPIGFLLMGAVFNVLSYFPNYRFLKDAMSFTLLAGFLAAVAACILGYLLSQSGEYDPEVLSQHRLVGHSSGNSCWNTLVNDDRVILAIYNDLKEDSHCVVYRLGTSDGLHRASGRNSYPWE